jgi:hypothetical protein
MSAVPKTILLPGVGEYHGFLVNDMRHGVGRLEFEDGELYEGEWFEDKMQGRGVYFYNDGGKYEGQWLDD